MKYSRNSQEVGVVGGSEQVEEVGGEVGGKVKGAGPVGPCWLSIELWLLL